MQAGFIGLGSMGEWMARNLAQAGFLSAVYNRTPAKATALAKELQVLAYDSPEALAAKVEVVFICVSADQDVIDIINAIVNTIKPDSIVVDMSTVSSATAILAAIKLAEKQVAFLDAPVSGGVEGAQKGTLSMMVGGETKTLCRVHPLLETLATRIIHMGPTGTGQGTKAVNQIMAAGINQAVTEALAFAAAQQLPLPKVIEVIGGGAAGNWFLEHRGLSMTQSVFKPGFKLALHHKDLKICQAMAKQNGASLPLIDVTVKDYTQLITDGYGDEDISALYRLKVKT
ncbi:MAG: NAD(P)-dependent oxidoreductase [Methylococcaceae bacterium]|nr:NAD(P)-dependent oxidoreductase [Methylococcaceae bacterium]